MKWRARLTQKILDNGWSVPDGLPRRSYEQVRVRCFKHADVFEWTTSAHNLLYGNKGTQGCGECYRVRLLTPDAEVRSDTVARGYTYIAHEVRDGRLHVTYTCGHGQTHTQALRSVQNTAMGCGCVEAESRGERTVRALAEKHTGLPWPKARKHDLRKLTGEREVPHELDMYCDALRTAIEFDGVQHLGKGAWGKDLAGITARDAARDAFCARHGIRLLRVSQAEFDQAWKTGLDEWWASLGVGSSPMATYQSVAEAAIAHANHEHTTVQFYLEFAVQIGKLNDEMVAQFSSMPPEAQAKIKDWSLRISGLIADLGEKVQGLQRPNVTEIMG